MKTLLLSFVIALEGGGCSISTGIFGCCSTCSPTPTTLVLLLFANNVERVVEVVDVAGVDVDLREEKLRQTLDKDKEEEEGEGQLLIPPCPLQTFRLLSISLPSFSTSSCQNSLGKERRTKCESGKEKESERKVNRKNAQAYLQLNHIMALASL